MWDIWLSLFLSGVFLGAGPCLISCGPFLLFFIAGAQKTLREGLLIWFAFSLARLFSYLLLGLGCGILSQKVVSRFIAGNAGRYFAMAAGVFIVSVGIAMLLGRSTQSRFCRQMETVFIKRGLKSAFAFGILIGLLPCAPLLAVLSYITLISKTWVKGVAYSFAFGLGTMVSPLVIIALLAALVPKIFFRKEHLLSIFSRACGLIIIFLGALILLKVKGG
ncbi:MAG: sulfite exporter TauE/SafE family protein [Candidatus Omnitrophota bacterium]